jgi:hypothetical protein
MCNEYEIPKVRFLANLLYQLTTLLTFENFCQVVQANQEVAAGAGSAVGVGGVGVGVPEQVLCACACVCSPSPTPRPILFSLLPPPLTPCPLQSEHPRSPLPRQPHTNYDTHTTHKLFTQDDIKKKKNATNVSVF